MRTKKIVLVLLALLLVGGGVWTAVKTGLLFNNSSPISNPDTVQIKNNGVLLVGVDATFNPMEYLDENGKPVGFGIDFTKEIAKEFGVPVQIKVVLWDDIFQELSDGKIDLIVSSVTITTERSKTMSFSKPYFNAGQVIMVLSDNRSIKSLTDLDGKTVGVQSNTTGEIEANKVTTKNKVVGYADAGEAITNLLSGKVDAVIVDYPVAAAKAKSSSKIVLVGGPFTQEFYGVVVAKGNEGLLQPVNKVIEKLINSGEMKKLENKWLKQI